MPVPPLRDGAVKWTHAGYVHEDAVKCLLCLGERESIYSLSSRQPWSDSRGMDSNMDAGRDAALRTGILEGSEHAEVRWDTADS